MVRQHSQRCSSFAIAPRLQARQTSASFAAHTHDVMRTCEGLRECFQVEVGQQVEDVLQQADDLVVDGQLALHHSLQVCQHVAQPALEPSQCLQ